jgi:hypothetical protein
MKTCNVQMDVNPCATGLTNNIEGFDYRGYLDIPEGVVATFTIHYGFSTIKTRKLIYTGPRSEDYLISHRIDKLAPSFLSCSRIGPLKTSISVQLSGSKIKTATSLVTVDSVDLSITKNDNPTQTCKK